MIYNFNHGMGWASSGVEYAQAYRANIFRRIGQDTRFVYTDMFTTENIQQLSSNLGFLDEEVIWLYMYFTDNKVAPTTFTLDELLLSLKESYTTTREGKICKILLPGNNNYYVAYMLDASSEYVHRVEIVKNGFLVRKDYYNNCKMFSEFYAPLENKAHLYQRHFYNVDGSLAYEEIIDGESVMYKFPKRVLYSKEELIGYMVESLNLSAEDVVIIDRTTKIGQSILQNVNDARVGNVIHAEHYSQESSDENNILWNNYYEYSFSQNDKFEFYIAATERQCEVVREHFRKYKGVEVNVYSIPVGSIDQLKISQEPRKKHSLITASRLASEKHVDWLIYAVAQVHTKYPDVTLDIYGKGSEEKRIRKIIGETQSEDYVTLKGHQDLANIYTKYETYVSASTSEGFGLTLLEAIGSGLPIVGFRVDYGNTTFVEEGKNGFLVEFDEKMNDREKGNLLADAIEKVFEADINELQFNSYRVAKRFLTQEVEKAWKLLLERK